MARPACSEIASPMSAAAPIDPSSYLRLSATPLAGLWFLLPWLGLYELAILTGTDPAELRHPAESWLQGGVRELGSDRPWLLPVVVAVSLLAWHAYDRWRSGPTVRQDRRGTVLAGMLGESAFLAGLLVFAGQLIHALATDAGEMQTMSMARTPSGPGAWAAACLGAGIYEEILFRLWAIPLLVLTLRAFLVPRAIAIGVSLAATSLLFAALHYTADDWSDPDRPMLVGFGLRAGAGLAFAGLFWLRGFGIAVGTHVMYDAIIVVIGEVQSG